MGMKYMNQLPVYRLSSLSWGPKMPEGTFPVGGTESMYIWRGLDSVLSQRGGHVWFPGWPPGDKELKWDVGVQVTRKGGPEDSS